ERAWFKNARFRVTPGLSARTPIVPRLERVFATMWLAWGAAALISREPGIPQKLQPVSVRLTRQQLRRALADSIRVLAAQIPAVVQEKLEQRQVVVAQLPSQ